MLRHKRHSRRGSMVPLMAVCAISLFAFVALAVDLGMLAVSRTQCQNAADAAALTGCRTLNNKPNAINGNLAQAVSVAKSTATANFHLSANFTDAHVQKVEAGQYLYDAAAQRFRVFSWADVTNSPGAAPPAGSWTALRVTMAVTQPTYFMKVFGVTSMPTGASATAVYRPRDVAFVLDMTGSMAYASTFNFNGASMNPDNLVPAFGHYAAVQGYLRASANPANGSGEAISQNNFTVPTPAGPPLVRNFFFDPANATDPTHSAYPVAVAGGTAALKNAFHRWNPPETPAPTGTGGTQVGSPTYDISGYDAFDLGTGPSSQGPTPAPDTFGTMTDGGGVTYVGDRWRRADGSIKKTETSWSPADTKTKAAANALELLGYTANAGTVYGGTTAITTEDKFRDPVWEAAGYDLDIVQYRKDRGQGGPLSPDSYTPPLVPAPDRFKGYSMGPGYWGKTFFIWPPDPRAPVGDPGDANYQPGDWRRRYFLNRNSAALDPQVDNNPATTGAGADDGINEVLLNTAAGGMTLQTTTTTWRVSYPAILKWIKSGPQVLPPNLRAGRVLYYSSIPDDVNTATGSAQQKLDKVFWKNYIDYVVGYGYTAANYLYGRGDSWAGAGTSIATADLSPWAGPAGISWPFVKPYMRYSDSPNRPRLHLWFGPLSMMDFLGSQANWRPGTCSEAQCWQLKAGMNAVIDDVRNNHPNDYVGLVMFAASSYNGIRRPMGQKYTSLKNALFYPKSLLDAIDAGDVSSEIRPYDLSFNSVAGDEIPNANGQTDPNTGLAYGFNLLSPSSQLPSDTYGTVKGRRGAAKVLIFETDGVPNAYRGLSSATRTMNPTLRGYDTYYPTSGWIGFANNGDSTSASEAIKVAQQIVKPVAATADPGTDGGLSLPNAPARVYPVAFGDLFDPAASPNATFRPTALQFLADVAAAGNTGAPGVSTIPDAQIITGSYDQRIARLKNCMQRIFQNGVAVVLIE
jgi:hypothetical protein